MNGMTELAKLLDIETDTVEQTNYNHSTYEIISKATYLIGVPKNIFENPHEPPKIDIYRELELNKNARIIDNVVQFNVIDMFDEILRDTRVEMSPSERKQFFDKYIKTLRMCINDDGRVSIDIKVRN